jgi:ABC-2 type transport system permease protein
MGNPFRSLIRSSAFLRKEIFEILRQPRLIFTLILGPFLILLIFGIGYRNQARTLRTVFVAPPNSEIAREIQQYAQSLGTQLSFAGITGDQKAALEQLRLGQVDLVAVAPQDAYNTILHNQQAVFTLYHREIDPLQVSYVQYFGQVYVDAINRRVLRSIAEQGQKDAASILKNLSAAHQNSLAMKKALQTGDQAAAQANLLGLTGNLDAVSQAVGVSTGLLAGIQQTIGGGSNNAGQLQTSLAGLHDSLGKLNQGENNPKEEQLANLDQVDQGIASLESKLAQFQSIDPTILVNPFISEVKSQAAVTPSPLDFFAPAVLALLLQHLAVTFAALSIVRERNTGTMELFRVSPLSAGEALFGKYLSYLLFGGVIAAALSALLVFGLHMPMLGNWWNFTLVVALLLFTSLGIGFAISIISATDSQAVQYSMIVLLASVFFSGFIMSLDMLWWPVHGISWLLPTTYGTVLLRDIALRGADPSLALVGGLGLFGLVLFVISWRLMRRLISSST